MNASKPDFLYKADVNQLTEAILWLIKDVDKDIISSALHNVAYEINLNGTLFSREDVLDSVKEYFYEQLNKTGDSVPDDDIIENITNHILQSDWWNENTLAVESSFSLYKHVEDFVINNPIQTYSSDNLLGEKENNV